MSTPASEISAPPINNTKLDARLVTLQIQIGSRVKTYNNLFISAVGVKYANPLQDEAEITIYNLDKETQDFLITETSPYNFNGQTKTATLLAGRQSYGTTVIYSGNIIYSAITQPPDIGVTLKCLTGNSLKVQVLSRFQPANTKLSVIAAAVAQDMDTRLVFEATDKPINNYSYSGSNLGQIEYLAALGQLNVFLDNGTLVVKNNGEPLRANLRTVSASTGMIGIPQFTERGVRVKFFIDNKTAIGGALSIQSEIYPSVNGIYIIYQLAFQVTNRLVPFYYIADCSYLGPLSEEDTSG